MDFDESIDIWNKTIKLKHPNVKDFKLETGVNSFSPVFSGVNDVLAISNLLFIKLPISYSISDGVPIQSIGMIIKSSYFYGSTLIKFHDFVGDKKLFGILPMKGSASEFLDIMEAMGLMPVDLVTDHEGFTIIFSKALSIEFTPNTDFPSDPKDSFLSAVQFNFGPVYRAKMLPEYK